MNRDELQERVHRGTQLTLHHPQYDLPCTQSLIRFFSTKHLPYANAKAVIHIIRLGDERRRDGRGLEEVDGKGEGRREGRRGFSRISYLYTSDMVVGASPINTSGAI